MSGKDCFAAVARLALSAALRVACNAKGAGKNDCAFLTPAEHGSRQGGQGNDLAVFDFD